jgi:HPt (histidine-containing phosphotransfer) domain-containing protein
MAQPLFDEAELLERVDNDIPFLAETVRMLSNDGLALLADVQRAITAGEAAQVARHAHTLKGMISTFCAPFAFREATELEQFGKDGDLASAAATARALETDLAALIAQLQSYLRDRN